MILAWGTPPDTSPPTAVTKYAEIAQELKDRQGEWGLIRTGATARGGESLVTRINTGANKHWEPVGHFEATSRSGEDGTLNVWARYLGEGAVPASQNARTELVRRIEEYRRMGSLGETPEEFINTVLTSAGQARDIDDLAWHIKDKKGPGWVGALMLLERISTLTSPWPQVEIGRKLAAEKTDLLDRLAQTKRDLIWCIDGIMDESSAQHCKKLLNRLCGLYEEINKS